MSTVNLKEVVAAVAKEMIKLNGKKPTTEQLKQFMFENGIITKAYGIFEFRYLTEEKK